MSTLARENVGEVSLGGYRQDKTRLQTRDKWDHIDPGQVTAMLEVGTSFEYKHTLNPRSLF